MEGVTPDKQQGGALRYQLTYEDGLATLRISPEADTNDSLQALNEIISASWCDEMLCVLILDEGSAFSPTSEELGQIKKLMDQVLRGPDVKLAIVVTRIVHFGIGRVLEARVNAEGRVRVFMNEQAAREWLGSCAL